MSEAKGKITDKYLWDVINEKLAKVLSRWSTMQAYVEDAYRSVHKYNAHHDMLSPVEVEARLRSV